MSRNAESRFSLAPSVSHPRSTFDRNQKIVTSAEVGRLIPFYVDEVLPGDTFQVDTHAVLRFTPMVSCPLDDIVFDTYYFYVPNRIVYDDWIRFMGESDKNAWTTPPVYKVPKVSAPKGGWNNGTIADYMGIPTKVENIGVNALPFRAFAKIYDFFFRDENLQDHVNCPTDGVMRQGVNTGNYVTDLHLGGQVPYANKLHDAFTSCLPNTQKAASPASIGLGNVPVVTGSPHHKVNPDYPLQFDVTQGGVPVFMEENKAYDASLYYDPNKNGDSRWRGCLATGSETSKPNFNFTSNL